MVAMSRLFANRADAGRILAEKLAAYAGRDDVIVLALPRGGVPVAYEAARALKAPLDVFLVRKLGAPGQEELAMGAIASGDVVVINEEVVQALKISHELVAAEVDRERRELARREAMYHGGKHSLDVEGKTVILIDDGLATGSTMRAAVVALRRKNPARVVVAVPIGAASTCAELREIADECICVVAPEHFRAVGLWYEDFAQTGDDEVCDLLLRASSPNDLPAWSESPTSAEAMSPNASERPMKAASSPRPEAARSQDVAIPADERMVLGTLTLPPGAVAVVVFAHGSGSGRSSPRNQQVARDLQEAGLGTLLIDLLEESEAGDRAKVFDIALLAVRLQAAALWLARQPDTAGLRLGYFGASTGAAAALQAAAHAPPPIGAIVSRGGRPDLARDALPHLTAPSLLIVGGNDDHVLKLNRAAFAMLKCRRRLEIIPGASHLFPEPGALEQVSRLARDWFLRYLTPAPA
jgi:putative phosphoribosyl transferase